LHLASWRDKLFAKRTMGLTIYLSLLFLALFLLGLMVRRFFFVRRKSQLESNDPLVHNDLNLPDSAPFHVSRHHVTLVNEGGHIGIMDRGSTLGAIVDGQPLGGKYGDPGVVFLGATGGTLILGTEKSPFRFQLTVGREREVLSDWQPPSPSEKRSLLKKLFERRG